jgi:hypothetical protein
MQMLRKTCGMMGSREIEVLSFRDARGGYFRLKLLTFTY